MRRPATLARGAAVTVLLAVVLGACSEAGSDSDSAPSPTTASSPSTQDPATDAELTGAPELGTCWQVPPVKAVDHDYWFDDSPQVPCTQPHTVETAAVFPLDAPTPELALEQLDACEQDARLYIGTDANNWVPWAFYLFLPTRAQVAEGASWTRCDVAFEAVAHTSRPTWRTSSAEEMVLRHPEEVWGCLDRIPPVGSPRPYVPCDEPHPYEATGHLLILDGLTAYPSARELRAEAADCRIAHRNPRYAGLPLRVMWSPRPPSGQPVNRAIGSCWASRPDGRDLPPLA